MNTLPRLFAVCLILATMLVFACGDTTKIVEDSAPPVVSMIASPSGPVCITPGQTVDFAGEGRDGPIGIDLLALPNGDIAVVSTGFNDDTYTITVFGPTGTLVSNDTQSVPAGCTAPPHAVWVPGTSREILFSCNATDNVFILPSGL